MKPGRFVTVFFLYLGTLLLIQYLLGIVFGELRLRPSIRTLGILLPAIGALGMGVSRIRNPEQEERPEEYGPWTYAAGGFLVVATGWLLYGIYAEFAM